MATSTLLCYTLRGIWRLWHVRFGKEEKMPLTHPLFHFVLLLVTNNRSVDAITAQQKAMPKDQQAHADPQTFFLQALTMEHVRLQQWYNSPQSTAGKPLVAVLAGLELGVSKPRAIYRNVDAHRFLLPTSVLRNDIRLSSSPILPLLRCVGVAHTLRILTALLSERRVIFCSASATRLSACSHAALSMLQCGNLLWQHLYIPVLPPHLWDYLAAPYPYVIGILAAAAPQLERRTAELGQCLQIFLDTNQMRVLGAEGGDYHLQQVFPDLFAAVMSNNNGAGNNLPPTAAEFLAQDLLEILKTDKKTLYGNETANAVLANVGETAGKAAKAIKSGLARFRARVKGSGSNLGEETVPLDETAVAGEEAAAPSDTNAGDYIFTEGCHNEVAEEEVRLAFTAFFLSLTGDLKWFLSVPGPGQVPVLDRQRYLSLKGQTEPEGSPVQLVLKNFCQTQMLEEFAKEQIAQLQSRQPVTADSTLFAQCAAYHRQHNIDFGVTSLRQISRQLAEASPGRLTGLVQTNARRMAMTLTSNKGFDAGHAKAVGQLVEECRESSSVLLDVMSVVWLRLRDSKGMQWKHALQSLQILKNLLYHGPLAVVAEATDGLDKIRAFKFYENIRQAAAQDVRNTASLVYGLLVDRTRLFSIRRVCAERRRELEQGPMAPRASRKVQFGMSFHEMHAALHPMVQGTVARMPTAAPPVAAVDVFGMSAGAPAGAPPPRAVPPPQAAADMVGLFDNMAVSAAAPAAAAGSNPFASPQPTIVSLPPKAQVQHPMQQPSPSLTPPHSRGAPPAFSQTPPPAVSYSGGAPPAFAQPAHSSGPPPAFAHQAPPTFVQAPNQAAPQAYYGGAPHGAPPVQQYPGRAPPPQGTYAAMPPQAGNPFGSPPPQGQPQKKMQNFDPFS